MPPRKRAKRKVRLKISRGPVLMALAVLWLGYRALTSPEDLGKLTRFIPGSSQAPNEDIGDPDGVYRLPAAATPTVSFDRLTAHCPSLGSLLTDTWIEIDEMGQVLSLESKDSGARPSLADCQFEPYRDATGRALSVRALYTVAK